MNYYRLYFFDSAGSIRTMAEMEHASDDAALGAAAERARQASGPWELWNRDRLVLRNDSTAAVSAE